MYSTFIIRPLFTFLLLCLSATYFYADDKYQAQMLEQMKKEIAREVLKKNPSPIQTALKRYKALGAFTFSGVADNGDSSGIARFLIKTRPLKISLKEWQALKKSDVALSDAENDSRSFTLLDLDEDGLRDLIVDNYSGGTGLYSYVSVYQQKNGRFISVDKSPSSEESSGELYSINGRGGDQEATWIRVNGRVYLAYRNGEYGKDELFLMRAFSTPANKSKGIVVEYSYRHSLSRTSLKTNGKSGGKLEDGTFAALQKGLNRINQGQKDLGQCPIPTNLPPEQQAEYEWSWFGPSHYTFEIVADFPFFEGNRCYAARLLSYKSSYLAKGYIATALWILRNPGDQPEEYNVQSVRIPQRVKIADIEYPVEN